MSDLNLDEHLLESKTGWNRGDLITLDVGGKLFKTRVSTLLPNKKTENLFTPLLEGSSKGEVIFIDRDPDYFAVVLNFLRTGILVCPHST